MLNWPHNTRKQRLLQELLPRGHCFLFNGVLKLFHVPTCIASSVSPHSASHVSWSDTYRIKGHGGF